MNRIRIAAIARCTFDPEMQYRQGGKPRLVFSVAVDQGSTATEERPAPDRCTRA